MWNLKNTTKLVNNTKKEADIENKLVVIDGEREGEGQHKGRGRKVIMGLYKLMCVKLLKTVKHYRI